MRVSTGLNVSVESLWIGDQFFVIANNNAIIAGFLDSARESGLGLLIPPKGQVQSVRVTHRAAARIVARENKQHLSTVCPVGCVTCLLTVPLN